MKAKVSRRAWLGGAAAGCAVAGFDVQSRSWVSTARASQCLPAVTPIPPLDGELSFEPADVAAASDDFGHIVSAPPVAVLHPGSIDDISVMVAYARQHGLNIAMRGQGHCQYGEAQVECGIVVDSRGLDEIEEVAPGYAVVEAGVKWSALVDAAFAQGLTPPVLTDYLELAVGGTLSVGGIGGSMQHHGTQADNVLELEVVTGAGERLTCSAWQRPVLFRAALAGLGQVAMIVKAKVRLVPAESSARVYLLFYDDLPTYLSDQEQLMGDGRFHYLEGQAVPNAAGDGWRYMIEAAAYYTAPNLPNDALLLAGLSDDVASRLISDPSYLEFAFRLAPLVAQLQALGIWDFPHPWLSLWVPASQAAAYLQPVFDSLTLEDTGQGPVLLYPVQRNKVQTPLFRLPNEPVAYAFNILKTAAPVPGVVDAMVAHNTALYEQLKAVGGTRYAIGALPFSVADWQAHYGLTWLALALAKAWYDPDGVLTPGPGIFSP